MLFLFAQNHGKFLFLKFELNSEVCTTQYFVVLEFSGLFNLVAVINRQESVGFSHTYIHTQRA